MVLMNLRSNWSLWWIHTALSCNKIAVLWIAVIEKENVAPTPLPTQKRARMYGGTPITADRLMKPFKCPGSATPTRASEKPARKRRKVNYSGADGEADDADKPYSNEDRLA
ncbi:hypothetical protein KCU59_g15895, partial [Aureobasidium melanogenum]